MIKPMKLRSGEWGISVAGEEEELERGTIVAVHTRDGSYFVSIRNTVWTGHNDERDEPLSIYGVHRFNDDESCPCCGAKVDLSDALDHGKPRYKAREEDDEVRGERKTYSKSTSRPAPKKKVASKKRPAAKRPSKNEPAAEQFDDDIPF